MHKNILSFWQHQENLPKDHPDRLSPRVCTLLQETFEKWSSKPPWIKQDAMGHLFDRRPDAASLSVAERKGLAIKEMFNFICKPEVREHTGTINIHPDELLVGTLPPYSVGQGKELMRYLTDDESLFWELRYYNEWSPFGHIVPDHEVVLKKGLIGIIQSCQEKQKAFSRGDRKFQFYQSVIDALEGVLLYANALADATEELALKFPKEDHHHKDLLRIAARLRDHPATPCISFMDALQTIYLMHCALHFTGEIVPIGRLDQLLDEYYENDLKLKVITEAQAQEALDCFWIKLDEKVILNRRFAEDRFTSSDGALLGSGGPSNFDQGALLNQWMQQITIGGIKANNNPVAEDACNPITFMCLASARRLPLNSPTLDLRVHKETNEKIFSAAAKTLLSGGAHPILMNDDKLIPALQLKTGGTVELKSARNYACDGCYETLFAGETEFSFGFVGALDVLEKALNSGAGFGGSGSTNLRGSKGSFRTPPASHYKTFDDFWQVLKKHIALGCHKFIHGILSAYGSKEDVSPSPLLSAMINGCIDKGRDLAGGGARYHLFSPLMTGVSTAADSLYVIQHLVFKERAFTLEELVSCLRSNWGRVPHIVGLKLPVERITEIRSQCRSQKKFGHGNKEVDQLAWKLIQELYDSLQEARNHPIHRQRWKDLANKYSEPGKPFEILFAPGIGTFEQFNFSGGFAGATPDGRFAFDPIASDLSSAPYHSDEDPLQKQTIHFKDGLKSYTDPSFDLLSDGAIADFNISEDVDEKALTSIIRDFARGLGSNMLTVTVADTETFLNAQASPAKHDLVRVRMGGWTEFFISLFPSLQEQHKRRPIYKHHK